MSPSIPPKEPSRESSENPVGHEAPIRPRIIVTAGPTHEPLDGVRYLANRSSGRMGISVAEAAAARGAPTTLLLGPTHLRPQDDSTITVKRFQTTAELGTLLEEEWPSYDVLFMAAAVADYRLGAPDLEGKHTRSRSGMTLELEPTPDLLAALAPQSRPNQLRVGWALEPRERLGERALQKLKRKNLDVIVANPLETIAAEFVEAQVLVAGSTEPQHVHPPTPRMTKTAFAEWLVELIYGLYSRAEKIRAAN